VINFFAGTASRDGRCPGSTVSIDLVRYETTCGGVIVKSSPSVPWILQLLTGMAEFENRRQGTA
jgi:hypothetical protein